MQDVIQHLDLIKARHWNAFGMSETWPYHSLEFVTLTSIAMTVVGPRAFAVASSIATITITHRTRIAPRTRVPAGPWIAAVTAVTAEAAVISSIAAVTFF